jgi:hypothetical protein
MVLHRSIYWVGRQWAVTGHGVQAVDPWLKGAFDIHAARVWEEGLVGPLRKLSWFNEADFRKALTVARERFPAPPPEATLPQQPADQPTQAIAPMFPAAPSQPIVALALRTQGRLATFLPQWRVRH